MPAATIDTLLYGGRVKCHFLPAKHYYLLSIPSLGRARIYNPGVTTIIGMKDKSGPLMYWAVDQCEQYALQAIEAWHPQLELTGTPAIPLEVVQQILAEMKSKYRDVKREAAEVGKVVHGYLYHVLVAKQLHRPMPERSAHLNAELTVEQLEQVNNAIDAGLQFFDQHHLEPVTMERPVWSPAHGYIGTDDFIGKVDGELCVVDYKTSKRLYPEVWLQCAAYKAAYMEEYPDQQVQGCWGVNVGKDGELDAQYRDPSYFEQDFKAFLGLRDIFYWDRVHGQGKPPIEIVGPLPGVQTPDSKSWIDELEEV